MNLTCTLPLPPTANNMYVTDFRTKRRFLSKAYNEWYKEACLKFRSIPLKGRIEANVFIYFTADRKGGNDIDGRLKPLLDLFVKKGVIEDDSLIYDLLVHKYIDKSNPRVEVTLTEID